MTAGVDGSTTGVPPHRPMSAVAQTHRPPAPVVDRTIGSRVLGDLVIPHTSVFAFPEGMHGFEAHQEYALVPAAREGFWWLQATDEAQLAFLLTDPFRVSPGYEVDLGAGDIRFLGLDAPEDALVLTVVTLPATSSGVATTNLRGPVVFNTATQRGRQVVSASDAHGMQVAIELPT